MSNSRDSLPQITTACNQNSQGSNGDCTRGIVEQSCKQIVQPGKIVEYLARSKYEPMVLDLCDPMNNKVKVVGLWDTEIGTWASDAPCVFNINGSRSVYDITELTSCCENCCPDTRAFDACEKYDAHKDDIIARNPGTWQGLISLGLQTDGTWVSEVKKKNLGAPIAVFNNLTCDETYGKVEGCVELAAQHGGIYDSLGAEIPAMSFDGELCTTTNCGATVSKHFYVCSTSVSAYLFGTACRSASRECFEVVQSVPPGGTMFTQIQMGVTIDPNNVFNSIDNASALLTNIGYDLCITGEESPVGDYKVKQSYVMDPLGCCHVEKMTFLDVSDCNHPGNSKGQNIFGDGKKWAFVGGVIFRQMPEGDEVSRPVDSEGAPELDNCGNRICNIEYANNSKIWDPECLPLVDGYKSISYADYVKCRDGK